MNRFDEMDMDLDVIYDDVRVDEKILGFFEEEGEEEVFSKFEILEGLVYMIKMIKMKLKHNLFVRLLPAGP